MTGPKGCVSVKKIYLILKESFYEKDCCRCFAHPDTFWCRRLLKLPILGARMGAGWFKRQLIVLILAKELRHFFPEVPLLLPNWEDTVPRP